MSACGEQFRSEILEVTHRGKTIAQFYLSVDGVYTLLVREKRIAERLKWLIDRGFGHLKLGSQLADLEWPEAVRLQWVIDPRGVQPREILYSLMALLVACTGLMQKLLLENLIGWHGRSAVIIGIAIPAYELSVAPL